MLEDCIKSGYNWEALPDSKRRKVDCERDQVSAVKFSKRKLTTDNYTVGWICPLEVEQIAAMEMLDEEHERLPQASTDHNVYNLGRIAGHNVVIAGLHKVGNNAAATVITQMRTTFRNLRFGLLVGIGGGVPVKTDNGMIRLGDIVVSKPAGGHSGAVQYDHGRASAGKFERIGAIAPPPAVLLNAAQDLAAKRARSRTDPVQDNIKRIDTSIRGLRKYKHPGTANDHLYEAGYVHLKPELTCDQCGCDPSKRVQRTTDDNDDEDDDGSYIIVHRGTIASGELVVKDAGLRDRLAEDYGLLCFEMEAAGALTDFPCMVIRGISDYCDSHKSDQWHGYAAAAAAAYSRQLFFHMPINEVERYISETTENAIYCMNLRQEDQDYQRSLEWLSPTNFPAQQHDIISRRQDGTAKWFLDSAEFQEWLQGTNETLFCPGIPGAGKTMMAAVAIDHLYQTTQNNDIGIACLFCSYKAKVDQTAPTLFAALLKQLVQSRPDIAAPVTAMYNQHSKRGTRPSLDNLMQSLISMCLSYSTVYVVVDALDECSRQDGVRREIMDKLRSLQASGNVRLLFTSRFIPEIEEGFRSSPWLEVRASEEDVARYITGQLPRLPKCIQRDEGLRNHVQTKIAEAADGMFLLARLHVDSLLDKRTKQRVLSTLDKLSKGSTALEDAYGEAIKRIEGQMHEDRLLAKRALCWISYACRLLTAAELCHTLAIEPDDRVLNVDNVYDIGDVISVCAGLVTVDKSGTIRLVHYTTQEYFERVRLKWNPTAQEEIAAACLTYLSFDTFKSGGCGSVEDLEQRLVENNFFEYSARYWYKHVRPVEHSTHVSNLALTFLCNDALIDSVNQVELFLTYNWIGYRSDFSTQTTALHLTARYGLVHMTERLLNREHKACNTNGDLKDHFGQTALSQAARKGYELVVKLLLDSDKVTKGDLKDHSSQTALSQAARNGHEVVVKLLLDSDKVTDVNSRDNIFSHTALSRAANSGHEAIVKLLLDSDKVTDIDSVDDYGQTALSRAAGNGHKAVVKLLLDSDKVTDGDLKDRFGQTALSWAARNRQELVVKLLLDSDKVTDGRAALLRAAEKGHEVIVKLLLDSDKVTDGRTALLMAAERGHEVLVKLLLDSDKVTGGDLQDRFGQTALSWAAWNGYKAVVKLLLDSNKVTDGRVALLAAAEKGHEVIVKLLLDSDKVTDGRTALSIAAEKGYKVLVKLLLDSDKVTGGDLQDRFGQIALSWAAWNGYKAVVKLLLDSDKVTDGRAALLAAAEKGHEVIVKLLLDSDKSIDGRTALLMAAEKGHEVLVKLLPDSERVTKGT